MWQRGSKNATASSLEGGGSSEGVTEVLKILEWCDAHLEEGSFFQDWTPCEHPQLGAVEIGGFKCERSHSPLLLLEPLLALVPVLVLLPVLLLCLVG